MTNNETGLCYRCGQEDSPYYYGPMMHPGTFHCERCIVEERLENLRAQPTIEELEKRLVELGGPAPKVYCGYVSWMLDGDDSKFGQFCWNETGHEGFHQTTKPE